MMSELNNYNTHEGNCLSAWQTAKSDTWMLARVSASVGALRDRLPHDAFESVEGARLHRRGVRVRALRAVQPQKHQAFEAHRRSFIGEEARSSEKAHGHCHLFSCALGHLA